jgi:DNA-binding response OmpR family regulator
LKTILVVEDEKSLLDAIEIKLTKNGFTVIKARSYNEAIESLETNEIDAIWLDHYLLGKESGLDIVTKIKSQDSKWKNIPVFVVSNTATSEKVQSYIHFGVEKYFVKSNFRLEEIICDINNCLKEK